MCGITGVVSFCGRTEVSVLKDMINALSHRGPDNQGIVIKTIGNINIGLAHSRLAIIDLASNANQPMTYLNYTIVFNGEIYNYREIRFELMGRGHHFITNSDTEVVLHAFEQWGKDAVNKFIGMFAFVLLDEKEHLLYLFRDRAGVKPLHYYWDSSFLLFGSELKSIVKHPDFKKEIDNNSVGYYFKFGYIPSPSTIYRNTYKLNPGYFSILNLDSKQLTTHQYWDSLSYYKAPLRTIRFQEAKEEIINLLTSACNYRMIADVPVGIFLSGGYDSTAVAAILQGNSTRKLRTFTIGFTDWYNEAPFANKTAKYLGTEHVEFMCTSKEAQDIIPILPYYFDEPFADSSAIPTYLVSKLAKNYVTVALSADAGDELFAGYDQYRSLKRNLETLIKLKFADNQYIGHSLIAVSKYLKPESFFTQKIHYLGKLFCQNINVRASSIHEGSHSMSFRVYERLLKELFYPTNKYKLNQSDFKDPISIAQAIDYTNYLTNDILTKVDRASMAVSLEGREPLVDHRLLEFVAQLPIEFKYDGSISKKILKDIVHDFVPVEMMNRPKLGFSLPISAWLRGELSYLLDEYLNNVSIRDNGYLNYSYVDHLLKLFKANKLHDDNIIWEILQFQMWYKYWM